MLCLLAIHINLEVSRTERIGVDLRELPCADPALEQDVNFSRTESLGLRKSEIRPNKREEAESAPNKATLSFQIPGSRVKNRWVEEVGDDAGDVVAVARNDDALDPQTRRWDLGDETVADGPDGDVVCEYEEHQQPARDPA